MKCIILAGGKGTRLGNLTKFQPKPLIEVGGRPLIWHIMKIYEHYSINEFIICVGYRGFDLINYFLNYKFKNSDLNIDLLNDKIKIYSKSKEKFNITFCETGENTGTAGRLKIASKYLINDDNFCLTYGDGLANINIRKVINSHIKSKKLVTVSAVQPLSRFGNLILKKNRVLSFEEKGKNNWVNGGFFVINKKALKYIKKKNEMWEREPLKKLVKAKKINVYKHYGFWQCVDHQRELDELNLQWKNKPKWKIWRD